LIAVKFCMLDTNMKIEYEEEKSIKEILRFIYLSILHTIWS
jgi:hypothetical protein